MNFSISQIELDRYSPNLAHVTGRVYGSPSELRGCIDTINQSMLSGAQIIDTGESSVAECGHPFGSSAVQVAIDNLPTGKWRHFAVKVGER